MLYLIQGIFAQVAHDIFELAHSDGDGIMWLNENRTAGLFVFAGLLFPDPEHDDPKHLIGKMHDVFGLSRLLNIEITKTDLRFTKHYDGRPDPISYEFKRQPDGTWIGYYLGVMGNFPSRCTLSEVPDDFLKIIGLEGRNQDELFRGLIYEPSST